MTTWDPVPLLVEGEGGHTNDDPGQADAASMAKSPAVEGPTMCLWPQSPLYASPVGEWQSDDDQPPMMEGTDRADKGEDRSLWGDIMDMNWSADHEAPPGGR